MTNKQIAELIEWYSNNDENELTSEEKTELIRKTKSNKFIKRCIKELGIGLSNKDRITLLKVLDDKRFTDECIMNDEYGFSGLDKVELIVSIMGDSYIDKLARLAIKGSKIDETVMNFLMLKVDDVKLREVYQDIVTRKFSLPKEMSIGIEVESEGRLWREIKDNFCFGGWDAVVDTSLEDGVEVVSPKFYPTEDAVREIYMVNSALGKLGQNTSERCGGHIHIGSDYLTSRQSYVNLMEIWCNTEKILYAICNEENTLPREKIEVYAKPVAKKTQEALKQGTINLYDEMELDEFIDELKRVQGYRYIMEIVYPDRNSGINLLNVNNGKNTIEFRLANGTLSPELWMDNINLFGGIVAVAEEITKIQENGIRSIEDKEKIDKFNRLKQEIEDEEKVEVLLSLVGVNAEYYMDRYESNIKLLNASPHNKIFSGVKGPVIMKFRGRDIEDIEKETSALAQQRAMEMMIADMEKSKIDEIQK